MIGQPLDDLRCVRPDNAGGAAALAAALADAGHTRFAVVEGPRALLTSRERADAFRERLSARPGCRVEWSIDGDFTRDAARAAARQALAEATPADGGDPLCVFAVTDLMALGVLAAARELGLDVPRQVAVAGFDDIATLRHTSPALSTVTLDLPGMGEAAARLVQPVARPRVSPGTVRSAPGGAHGASDDTPPAAETVDFPATPVLRESTQR